MAKLDALSPLAVLTRGFSITQLEDGTVVRDPTRAAELERVLRGDFDRSCQIILERFLRRSRIQRLKESLVRPLAPLL